MSHKNVKTFESKVNYKTLLILKWPILVVSV